MELMGVSLVGAIGKVAFIWKIREARSDGKGYG